MLLLLFRSVGVVLTSCIRLLLLLLFAGVVVGGKPAVGYCHLSIVLCYCRHWQVLFVLGARVGVRGCSPIAVVAAAAIGSAVCRCGLC